MLLYLIQREFLTQKKQKCFGCRFEKEYHVPVLQPVYRTFRKYGTNPIPEQAENYGKYIREADKELINSVVDKYAMSTNSTISKYVEMLNRIDNCPSAS